MDIKAVLLDIDNTLLDFNKSAVVASQNTVKKHSVTLPDGYSDVFFKVNDYLWGELERGSIIKQDIYDRRWNMIFSELGIAYDGKAFEEDFRKEMRVTAIPVDGATEILQYLSEKYPVYLASNASRLQQETRLKSSGLYDYVSGLFTSEEIGFQKPNKEFFYGCMSEIYPVLPHETVMIGDNVDADIIGAKNFGLKTIWFNYHKKEYDNYNFTDFCVKSLEEIKNIL